MKSYSPTMKKFSQLHRIVATEKYIMFPVKFILIALALILTRLYPTIREEIPSFFNYQLTLYILGNLVFGYVLIKIAQKKFKIILVKICAFILSIIDNLFLSVLLTGTGGAMSNLYWAYCGLMVRNAINFSEIKEQIFINLSILLCYIGASLDRQAMLGAEYKEIFVVRTIILLLISICCWGIYVLLQRKSEENDLHLEVQMRQQKLLSTGRLAAEVAHGLKNPLSIINNACYSLQQECQNSSSEKLLDIAAIIRDEVQQADRLLNTLMDFSKLSMVNIKKLNANDIILKCLESIQHKDPEETIQIHLKLDPDLPVIVMDEGHLHQIISNLIINAMEAMLDEGGGTFTINSFYEDNDVWFIFEDSGPGIHPDNMQDVFKPFFTTKEKGTGLGLTIVKNLIETYDGEIIVHSKPNQGTKIQVRLPLEVNVG